MYSVRQLSGQITAPTETRVIPLQGGQSTIVDALDYERVVRFSWSPAHYPRGCYAYGSVVLEDGQHRGMLMHRFILVAPADLEVDHRNGDGLDNRRSNIRLCTHLENARNRHSLRLKKSSKWKGVVACDSQIGTRWRARIHVSGRNVSLGSHDTELLAALAYDAAAVLYFGEFAALNFPDPRCGQMTERSA